jgi:transposase
MRPLPKAIVDNAIAMLQNGNSARATAMALRISISSAIRIQQQQKENIPSLKKGRHKKVSKATRATMARQMRQGALRSIHEAQQYIESVDGCHVHGETVRRYLRQEGLKAYVKSRKPDLTKDQMKARRKFAKEHMHWTVDDWKRVMFSDETLICWVGHFGRGFYYRKPKDKRLLPHHFKRSKQGGGGKIMVWGCLTYFGVGDACKLDGGVDSEAYVGVLRDYVLASRDWYGMEPSTFIFQQDNAPIHTSRAAKTYLTDNNISVLEWPANSPDINIIEGIWAYIKQRLDDYENDPKDEEELWKRVQDVWTMIPIKII